MRRRAFVTVGLLLLLGVTVAVQQQVPTAGRLPDRRNFQGVTDPRYPVVLKNGVVTQKVAGQVSVVAMTNNVVVMAGDDGVLLVDNSFAIFWDQIRTAIRQISDKPVRYVITTHDHGDHNENNEPLARLGATVFSHPNTRIELARPRSAGGRWERPTAALPAVTSADPITIHFNGEEVTIVPLKRTHSMGDVGVYFHGSDVFAFGDVFTNDYPAMGVRFGASVENFVDSYNTALLMGTPNTRFIPGHGQVADRSKLIYTRDALTTIHDRFLTLVNEGKTLEQILQLRPTKEFDQQLATEICCVDFTGITGGSTSASWYRTMYDEAMAHKNGTIGTVHVTATAAAAAAAAPAAPQR